MRKISRCHKFCSCFSKIKKDDNIHKNKAKPTYQLTKKTLFFLIGRGALNIEKPEQTNDLNMPQNYKYLRLD